MDPKQEKELTKKKERKEDHREEMARETVQEQKEAKGPRIVSPFLLGAVGFVLAMLAILLWSGVFR